MLGKINNVYQWSQEAQKYTEEGAGDELPHLNDDKSLVPFEQDDSFLGTIFGRKVARQAESFKTTCLELAQEADGLAENIGIMDRIAENQEEKNWDEMTIEQLAGGFDELLTTPSVQLLKAKKTLDELVACCYGLIHCEDDGYDGKYVSQLTLKQQLEDFPAALKEVFEQLNRVNGAPEKTLQQIKDLLQTDVQNALVKICIDPDHNKFDAASSLASDISFAFDKCMKALAPGAPALEENLDNSVKGRIEQMLEDLKNPSKHGADLNERIRELAKDIASEVEKSEEPAKMLRSIQDQCEKQLALIVKNDLAMRLTVEPVQTELVMLKERYKKTGSVKPKVQPPKQQMPLQRKSPPPTQHIEASTAKPAPAASLASLKQEIGSLAQKTSDHQTRAECQRLMASIKNYAQNPSLPLERALAEVGALVNWLSPVIDGAKDRFAKEIMTDELLIPVTGLHEALSARKKQQSSPQNVSSSRAKATPPPGVPPQSRGVTEQELWQKRLISNHGEYVELSQILPQGFLTHPDIVECLSALRKMQSFNRGISNQDFAHLAKRWAPQKLFTWAQNMNRQSAGQAPYLRSSEEMRNALKEIGLARNISPQITEVISMLEINGLSVPHIFEQLHALDFLARTFPGESIPLQDIPYIINHDILTPYMLGQIRDNQNHSSELLPIQNALQENAGKHWDRANNGVEDFKAQGITEKTQKYYGLVPQEVTANDDSLFHAIGHLKAEPMRKVRERCHWAAQDILDMSQGRFQGDMRSAYAGRVTKAARTMNLDLLAKDVQSHRLLLPSCERRDRVDARGYDEDLTLLAIAYGCSIVPVDNGSNYFDVHGYYADGKRYQYRESRPAPVDEMRGQPEDGPYMLIDDGKHWRPLVSER